MKPLNQAERTTRLWKFTLLYLLALVVPVGASYFLFSDGSIVQENQKLKLELQQTKDEQQRLLTQMDTLTRHLQRIDVTDRQLRTETNDLVVGELKKRTQDNLNYIALSLSELRRDSIQMQAITSKRIAQNVLRNFDLFRNNRNTIDFLRQSLDQRGIDVSDKEQLAAELAQTKQLLATFQAAAANRPTPMALSSGGGGGGSGGTGGGSGSSARILELQRGLQDAHQQVDLLEDKVTFANADCTRQRASSASGRRRKEMLEQARKGYMTILQNPSSDDMKQSVEKMIEIVDKELKKGIFN